MVGYLILGLPSRVVRLIGEMFPPDLELVFFAFAGCPASPNDGNLGDGTLIGIVISVVLSLTCLLNTDPTWQRLCRQEIMARTDVALDDVPFGSTDTQRSYARFRNWFGSLSVFLL
jgi:hypothetical protein